MLLRHWAHLLDPVMLSNPQKKNLRKYKVIPPLDTNLSTPNLRSLLRSYLPVMTRLNRFNNNRDMLLQLLVVVILMQQQHLPQLLLLHPPPHDDLPMEPPRRNVKSEVEMGKSIKPFGNSKRALMKDEVMYK